MEELSLIWARPLNAIFQSGQSIWAVNLGTGMLTLHRQIIHKNDPLNMPDFMVVVPGPTINIPEVIDCQHHLEPALMGCPD